MSWLDVFGVIIVVLGIGILLFPLQLPPARRASCEEEKNQRIARDRTFGVIGAILIAVGCTLIIEL